MSLSFASQSDLYSSHFDSSLLTDSRTFPLVKSTVARQSRWLCWDTCSIHLPNHRCWSMFDKLTRRSDGSIGESFPVDTVYATNEARQSFVFLSFRSPCFRLWVYCFWSGFAYRLGHATCCDSSRWIISPHFQHAAVLSGVAWLEITIGVAIGKTARILYRGHYARVQLMGNTKFCVTTSLTSPAGTGRIHLNGGPLQKGQRLNAASVLIIFIHKWTTVRLKLKVDLGMDAWYHGKCSQTKNEMVKYCSLFPLVFHTRSSSFFDCLDWVWYSNSNQTWFG